MQSKLDKIWLGLVVGILMPLLFGYIFVRSTYTGEVNFVSLMRFMSRAGIITKLIFIAVLPDMGAVFVLNSLEMWRACRGVFVSLGVYMVLSAIMLFL